MTKKQTYEDLEKRIQELERAVAGHKPVEEALQESEARYRTLAQYSQTGIYIHIGGHMKFVNNRFAEMLGYTQEEIVGRQYWEFVHPEDREMVKKISLDRARGKTAPAEYEFRHLSKDGKTVWVHNLPIIIKYQGQIANMGNLVQINDRKQVEEQLKAEREKLLSIFDSIDEVIYVADPETYELLYINGAFKNSWGDGLGQKCYTVLQNRRSPCPFCTNDHILGKNLGQPYTWEFQNSVNGRWYRCIDKAISWPDGRVVRYEIAIDIHDFKQADEEKLRLEIQLQQAQKMESIGNLAGGIAHDFNNILSSIIGFTELALDDSPEDTQLEDSLQEIYSAGKRAKELVQQILAFARQSDEKRSPIRPNAIVNEVLHFIRSTLPTTIEIRQSIESDSMIIGNATQIHQVLMNLCTNAAHAMEESGGILDVSLKNVVIDKKDLPIGMKPGDYLEVKVSDTGVGIPPEIIGSVFEPYFTTKSVGEGTGMGLAMVQGVVESHSGKITVDSRMGEGTTFSIYLPTTIGLSAQKECVLEQIPKGTERILFVDDEAPIAKIGSQILERLGYSLTTRTSSVEALELFKAKTNDFDLVVTDMTMPNLTGDKLATEMMKIRPDIPVVLCTGYSKKLSEETASEIGIKAFAYKPVVKADLAKTVRKVLDEAKAQC